MSPDGGSLGADLDRARVALLEADLTPDPDDRFLAAHLVALRVAAVALALRGRPDRSRGRRNAWRAVADAVPALADWAATFAATEVQRDAVSAGRSGVVTAGEADEVLRDAAHFLDLVSQGLAVRPLVAAAAGAGRA